MDNNTRYNQNKTDWFSTAWYVVKTIISKGSVKSTVTKMILKKTLPFILGALLVLIGFIALFTYIFVQVFT